MCTRRHRNTVVVIVPVKRRVLSLSYNCNPAICIKRVNLCHFFVRLFCDSRVPQAAAMKWHVCISEKLQPPAFVVPHVAAALSVIKFPHEVACQISWLLGGCSCSLIVNRRAACVVWTVVVKLLLTTNCACNHEDWWALSSHKTRNCEGGTRTRSISLGLSDSWISFVVCLG